MAWNVTNYLSTRKTGKENCEEMIDWVPGDRVMEADGEKGKGLKPPFPAWVPVDAWHDAGYILTDADLDAAEKKADD